MTTSDVNFACPLCGSTQSLVVLSDTGYEIRSCATCQLAATIPASYVSQADYDESPQCAGAYAAQEDKTREYARKILKSMERVGAGKKLLDVGCSIGIVVEEAGRAGFEAQGIDLDSNAIQIGQSAGRNVQLAALESWAESDYNWICLSHTLEHIPQPVEFLQSCAAHLKPGGCIIVVVPCYRGLHPQKMGRRWYGWLPQQHFFHYSAPALRRLFQKAGLEPVRLWQESMDHRLQRKYLHSAKDLIKALISYGIATLGGWIGRGDQLVGIGRHGKRAESAHTGSSHPGSSHSDSL